MKCTLALTIAFIALLAVVLLFGGPQNHRPPQPSPYTVNETQGKGSGDNSWPSSFSPIASANNSGVTVSMLDNDLVQDRNPSGFADPLVVVAVISVLAALTSGALLLALYELEKLFSIWLRPLERPG